MNESAYLLEEAQVADAEGLCSTFFLGDIFAKVLTGSHREKERASAERSYCNVFDGGASINELSKDDEQERFLLFDVFFEAALSVVLLRKKDRQFYIVIEAGI